jgi:hypothetical protein
MASFKCRRAQVSQHPPAHQLMEPAEKLFPVWPPKQLHGALMGAGSLWTCTRGWHLTLICIVIEEMLCTHLRIEQSGLCVINCPSDSCSSWWGITHVGCVLNTPNLPSWVVHNWLICNDPLSSLLINFIIWSMSKCHALNFDFQMYSWLVIRTNQLTQEVRLNWPIFRTHISNLSKLSHML